MQQQVICWSPTGFQVTLILEETTPGGLATQIAAYEKAGFRPFAPPQEEIEKSGVATVAVAIRRTFVTKKGNQPTEVIDLYPAFVGNFSPYGQHRVAHFYVTNPQARAEFEQHAGLRLEDMPIYNNPTALQRDYRQPREFEVDLPTPFQVLRKYVGQDDRGMPSYEYHYAGNVPENKLAIPPNTPATTPASPKPKTPPATTPASPKPKTPPATMPASPKPKTPPATMPEPTPEKSFTPPPPRPPMQPSDRLGRINDRIPSTYLVEAEYPHFGLSQKEFQAEVKPAFVELDVNYEDYGRRLLSLFIKENGGWKNPDEFYARLELFAEKLHATPKGTA